MIHSRLPHTLTALLLTLLLLMALEVISATFIPAIGLEYFFPPFNILFILFLVFRIKSPFLPLFILIVQLTHGIFSIESWSQGTLIGLLIYLGISYLKNIIDFSTTVSTMMITLLTALTWHFITSLFLYMNRGDFSFALNFLWESIPECLFISILSPALFNLLGRIWKMGSGNRVGV
ncbi:MAG: hypothetical protein OXB88_10605 [Bacteriovoracales bacterium]|nr:hypothetical protein [Bacteriovoracales bacterium]